MNDILEVLKDTLKFYESFESKNSLTKAYLDGAIDATKKIISLLEAYIDIVGQTYNV